MALSFFDQNIMAPQGDTPETAVPAERVPERDSARKVQELLGMLQLSQAIPPPEVTRAQKVLGGLGDAMRAAAAAKLGQVSGEGHFARQIREQNQMYLQSQIDAQRYNDDLRNKVILSQVEGEQDHQRAMDVAGVRARASTDVAGIRATNKPLRFIPGTENVGGTPTNYVDVYDAVSGTYLGRNYGGEKGYAPVVIPGTEVGPDNKPSAGIFKIPKGSGKTERVGGPNGSSLEPQPNAAFTATVGGQEGVLSGIPAIMDEFAKADAAVGGSQETMRQVFNWARGKAAQTSVGPIVAPKELVNYYRNVKSVLFPLVKAISGATFPEQELDRYESQFPIPGVDTADTAPAAWDALIKQISRDIEAKYSAAGRTRPSGSPAQSGPASGKSLPASAFSRLPPEKREIEKARFVADGGTIVEGM